MDAKAGEAIGMMDGAYFVSRYEILSWANELLGLNYTKIEQFATGAAHCQLLHILYPDAVPLQKVNFNATLEHQSIANFKVLQNAFNKLGIDKHVEVDKLVKAKYLDNLEFVQWMKRYFEIHYDGTPYDAVYERDNATQKYNSKRPGLANIEAKSKPAAAAGSAAPAAAAAAAPAPAKPAAAGGKKAPSARAPAASAPRKPASSASAGAGGGDDARVKQLEDQVAELKVIIDGLERERDFYFGKLRDIEILAQNQTEAGNTSQFVEDVTKILYATDEDFVIPEDTDGGAAQEGTN